MRRPAAVLASVLALAVVANAQQPAPPRTAFQELYDAYIAGDTAVVLRSIQRPEHLAAIRGDLFNAVAKWRRDFERRQALFLIEVATVGLREPWATPADVLRSARLILSERKTPIGTRPEEDQFELIAHHAAATILLGAGRPDQLEEYVRALGERVTTNSAGGVLPRGPAGLGARQLTAPRLLMYPAFAAESLSRPSGVRGGPNRATLVRAANLYENAMREPENASEARVRRGFLLYRLGDMQSALAALEPEAAPSDRAPEFWRLMARGKVQQALNRPADAEAEYRRAAAFFPGAQTPLVALATLFVVQGRASDAQAVAAAARTQALDGYDPWWDYYTGDMRFLNAWMQELRRLAFQ